MVNATPPDRFPAIRAMATMSQTLYWVAKDHDSLLTYHWISPIVRPIPYLAPAVANQTAIIATLFALYTTKREDF